MPSVIKLRDPLHWTVGEGDLDFRWENTTLLPLIGASILENGAQYPGQYELQVQVGGTQVLVAVQGAEATKNPYHNRLRSIIADGITPNLEVLPGSSLIFHSGLGGGEIGKISMGDFLDATLHTFDRRLNHGIVLAGTESGPAGDGWRISYVNVGDEDGADCVLNPLPGFVLLGDTHSQFLFSLRNHYGLLYEKAALPGTKMVSFQNYGGLAPPVVDVWVQNLTPTPGPNTLAILAARLDGTTPYYYLDGHGYVDANNMLPGMRVILADDPGDPVGSTFTIDTRAGWELVELALDVTGSPGTWQSGPITMTGDGSVISGVVGVADQDIVWIRFAVPDVEEPGPQRLVKLRARTKTI